MNYEKVELLINNSRELDNAGGVFTVNSFKKCSALTLSLNGEVANANRINEAIGIIKENTSVFSNFRGDNLFVTAIAISQEENMKEALDTISGIHEKLKNHFFTNEYLVIASIVLFNARERVNVDEAAKNTRVIYELMKKNHRFLTGHDDITAAAMIATTSINFEETMRESEEIYKALKQSGFFGGDNLQGLSHILPLFSGSVDEKVHKTFLVQKALKDNKVPLKYYSLPLLGIAAIVTDEPEIFSKKVSEVSERLKREKGFGNFTLGSQIRNMIAVGVVASDYVDILDEASKEKLINTTNNVALTIQIAIQIAATSAAAATIAASASAGS